MIVATGGTAVVRAAYRSGNPALGVGPGNVPALVDATADLGRGRLADVECKSFDNSILCTNESVLIAEERSGRRCSANSAGAAPCCSTMPGGTGCATTCSRTGGSTARRSARTPPGSPRRAGLRVPPRTQVLLAPFALVVPEEPLAREKLFPLLGMVRVPDVAARHRGRARGGADRRRRPLGGDPLPATRGRSSPTAPRCRSCGSPSTPATAPAAAGLDTNLAPSMTLGTGFCRAQLDRREPAAAAPGQLDPGCLRTRRRPCVRRLRRDLQPWRRCRTARCRACPRGSNRRCAPPSRRRRPRRHCGRRSARSCGALIIEELRQSCGGSDGRASFFIFIDQLQPQTMCYLGTWVRGRLPRLRMAAQVIEVAPGLDIEPLTDVALKHTEAQAGILVVERQFGYLEFHAHQRRGRSRPARPCSARSAQRRTARPAPQVLAARIDHAHRPPARVPDQPQQARLDGAAGRVAVRARDAARLVRDPGRQRGREGCADQGRRLPDDRRHRPGLPVRPGSRRAAGRRRRHRAGEPR